MEKCRSYSVFTLKIKSFEDMKIFLLMYLDAQFHSDGRQRRTESSQQNALSVRTNGPRDFIFRALLKLLLFPGYKKPSFDHNADTESPTLSDCLTGER